MNNVLIKHPKKNQFWTGSMWSPFKDDAVIYPRFYAEQIVKKRWGNGLVEYYTNNKSDMVHKKVLKRPSLVTPKKPEAVEEASDE